MKFAKSFASSKTTWAGLAAILAAVASALAGQMTWGQAEQQIVIATLGICLRDCVAKTAAGGTP
jgi:hypothetical protein